MLRFGHVSTSERSLDLCVRSWKEKMSSPIDPLKINELGSRKKRIISALKTVSSHRLVPKLVLGGL